MVLPRKDLFRLVEILADGECHSGESLGDRIGVTRAAIWKRLQQLEELGLHVESLRGQGYRLSRPLDLLSQEVVTSSLSPSVASLLVHLMCLRETTSTNDVLLGLDCQGPAVCVAEWQSGGRGRRGRQWQSPYAANLCFSIRWPFDGGIAALEGLSLAVGVLVGELLVELGVSRISLKWPNDILVEDAKLAGVLIEVGGDLSGDCFAVIGVGVNVDMEPRAADGIGQPWTDLKRAGVQLGRSAVFASILNRIIPALQTYQDDGFSIYRQRWLALAAFLNQQVNLTTPAGSRTGVFRGIDHHGAFAFDVEGCVEWVSGGEVSLRQAR